MPNLLSKSGQVGQSWAILGSLGQSRTSWRRAWLLLSNFNVPLYKPNLMPQRSPRPSDIAEDIKYELNNIPVPPGVLMR